MCKCVLEKKRPAGPPGNFNYIFKCEKLGQSKKFIIPSGNDNQAKQLCQLECDDWNPELPSGDGLKSVEGRQKTSVRFVNEMNEDVDVYWMNYNGQRQYWFMLGPGEEREQPTYVTHPWLVVTSNNATFLASIIGRADKQVITVRGPNNSDVAIL